MLMRSNTQRQHCRLQCSSARRPGPAIYIYMRLLAAVPMLVGPSPAGVRRGCSQDPAKKHKKQISGFWAKPAVPCKPTLKTPGPIFMSRPPENVNAQRLVETDRAEKKAVVPCW